MRAQHVSTKTALGETGDMEPFIPLYMFPFDSFFNVEDQSCSSRFSRQDEYY